MGKQNVNLFNLMTILCIWNNAMKIAPICEWNKIIIRYNRLFVVIIIECFDD
jgi:hypothetical protein